MSAASLLSQLNGLKKKKKDLEKRRDGVKKIISTLNGSPSRSVDYIKKHMNTTAGELDDGIRGITHVDNVESEIRYCANTAGGLDNWGDLEYLGLEAARLDREIEDLSYQIQRVQWAYQQALEEEMAARMKALAQGAADLAKA